MCDVNGFRLRSDATYGTLALDYIAEQYQEGDGFFVDVVTVIKMNDKGSILFEKEPLDWVRFGAFYHCINSITKLQYFLLFSFIFASKILFNKVLDHMKGAKPKSHGNYIESLELVASIIDREAASFDDLDVDDMPAFTLVFISDGKPSDKLPDDKKRRRNAMW